MTRIISLIIIFALFIGFGTACCQDSITDYEGNKYTTAIIGKQIWMTQNLKSKYDAKGKIIRRVCYGNFEHNCNEYGALYRWDDLMINSPEDNKQGICPDGWHIPADEEWSVLINYLGGADSAAYKLNRNIGCEFDIQLAGNYHSRLNNFNFQGEIAYFLDRHTIQSDGCMDLSDWKEQP